MVAMPSDSEGVSQPAASAPLTIRQIAGFAIVERIGQGGMGSVFKARQTSLDRIVALKVLPPSLARNTSFIERFQREARASAKLNHENIVQGIDVGQDSASGLWYFAMEYVDGPSLRDVLKQQGALPEEQALRITRSIASALECAQKSGIVHRDIKPDNILMASADMPKLADLGLAKQTHDDASLTLAGTTVGTPHYMAPEQVRGQADRVDVRTDLYSLGGTLFHLVTGQTPFSGETPAVIMAKQLNDTPPRANKINPKVSDACARLIAKLMQKAPEKRIQTPGELMQQIDAILAGEATGPRQPVRGTTGPHGSISERRAVASSARSEAAPPGKMSMVLAAAGGALVLLIGGMYLLSGRNENAGRTDGRKGVTPKTETVAEKKPVEPLRPAVPRPTEFQPKPPETKLTPSPQEQKAAEMFAAAEDFARKNPDDVDGVVRQYTQVIEMGKGTAVADRVEAVVKEIQRKLGTAAAAALQEVKTESDKLAESGDFDAALAKLDEIKKQEKTYALVAETYATARKALVEKAEAAVKEALRKSDEVLQASPAKP